MNKKTLFSELSLLLLTASNKGDPLPGGYSIFIPAGDGSMMLVDGKRMGMAGR